MQNFDLDKFRAKNKSSTFSFLLVKYKLKLEVYDEICHKQLINIELPIRTAIFHSNHILFISGVRLIPIYPPLVFFQV